MKKNHMTETEAQRYVKDMAAKIAAKLIEQWSKPTNQKPKIKGGVSDSKRVD